MTSRLTEMLGAKSMKETGWQARISGIHIGYLEREPFFSWFQQASWGQVKKEELLFVALISIEWQQASHHSFTKVCSGVRRRFPM